MALANQIEDRLREALAPESLTVLNESHLHSGHAGDDGSGESHWRVVIEASRLKDLSRLERHRAVHTALGQDVMSRLHALAIEFR